MSDRFGQSLEFPKLSPPPRRFVSWRARAMGEAYFEDLGSFPLDFGIWTLEGLGDWSTWITLCVIKLQLFNPSPGFRTKLFSTSRGLVTTILPFLAISQEHRRRWSGRVGGALVWPLYWQISQNTATVIASEALLTLNHSQKPETTVQAVWNKAFLLAISVRVSMQLYLRAFKFVCVQAFKCKLAGRFILSLSTPKNVTRVESSLRFRIGSTLQSNPVFHQVLILRARVRSPAGDMC